MPFYLWIIQVHQEPGNLLTTLLPSRSELQFQQLQLAISKTEHDAKNNVFPVNTSAV